MGNGSLLLIFASTLVLRCTHATIHRCQSAQRILLSDHLIQHEYRLPIVSQCSLTGGHEPCRGQNSPSRSTGSPWVLLVVGVAIVILRRHDEMSCPETTKHGLSGLQLASRISTTWNATGEHLNRLKHRTPLALEYPIDAQQLVAGRETCSVHEKKMPITSLPN